MAKGTSVSKAVAVGIGVLTVSSVCGLVLMTVMFQIQIEENTPLVPPRPTKPPVIPTGLPPNLRLPDNLIPESYKVILQPYFYSEITNNYTNQSFVFTGNSTVRLRCIKDSKTIFLHVHNLNVTDVEVRESNSNKKLQLKRYTIHHNESNFLEIQLENDVLSENGTYDLFTNFEGELSEDLAGFYVSEYTEKSEDKEDEDKEDKIRNRFLATSLLQPTSARKVFPCFDEPALKAVFDITIIHRPGTIALSNKPIKQGAIKIDEEEWIVQKFETTPIMSTHQLAFTLSDFDDKMIPDTYILTNIYARKEAMGDDNADYAAEIVLKILRHYEAAFGLKYRLGKLDHIALPDFSDGAKGGLGLISYQESGLLFNEATGSTFDKERVATTIAHGLAQQWFGGIVTMRWWNDLWLNEAFATYMSYTGVEAPGVDWDLRDLFVLREIQSAFQVDSLNSSHPLSLNEYDVQTFSEIIELYDDITRSKGAAVLRMLSEFMTKEAFNKGLQTYLTKFQYNNTVYKDLLECLNEETNQDLEAFMSTWIEQVGYPVVTIDTQTGQTSQEHFLLKQEKGHNIPWQVEITYVKSDDLDELKRVSLKVGGPITLLPKLKDKVWLLANINCTGFYRVNYDEKNWNGLLKQLEDDYEDIPIINRGQLIDDAFNLARAHRLNVTIALSLTKFLVNDTEYIPWESALKNLDYFVLMFDRSEVYGSITKYIRKQVEGLYEHFKEYTENGTIPVSHTDQYNQVNAISVACSNGLPDCIEMAKRLFEGYKKNDNTTIHPNLKSAIFCSAIAAGDEYDWEFLWEEYQKTTIVAEKDKLRYALSCTKEIWLLNRYLEYTLDPSKIRKMDMVSTINYIARNVAGQPLAWDFVRSKWSYITREYGVGITSLGSLLDGVTKRFSRDVELEEVKQLQREQDKANQGLAARALEQIIERTEANIQWVNENKQNVKEWFEGELNQNSIMTFER